MRAVFQTQRGGRSRLPRQPPSRAAGDLQRPSRAVLAQREADRARPDRRRRARRLPPRAFRGERPRHRRRRPRAPARARPTVTRTPHRSSRTSPGTRCRSVMPRTVATSRSPSRDVLRSEHNNLARLWEDATPNERLVLLALHEEPGRPLRRGVPAAIRTACVRDRCSAPSPLSRATTSSRRAADGSWTIAEPFLHEWLDRGVERVGGGAEH